MVQVFRERISQAKLETFFGHSHAIESIARSVEDSRVTPEQKAFRARLVLTCLEAGYPLKVLDDFRPLFESIARNPRAFSWTESSHLARDYGPAIAVFSRREYTELLNNRELTVIFDGASHLGEVLGIVFRFICHSESGPKIHHLGVRLFHARPGQSIDLKPPGSKTEEDEQQLIQLVRGLDANALCRLLGSVLNKYGIVRFHQVLFTMHDRAAVNFTGINEFHSSHSWHTDTGCLSHFMNSAGERLEVPGATRFMDLFRDMFEHSEFMKTLWHQFSGLLPLCLSYVCLTFLQEPSSTTGAKPAGLPERR